MVYDLVVPGFRKALNFFCDAFGSSDLLELAIPNP